MKRIAIALVLSALTFVGGHFFNRRWDRAVLFFAGLAFFGIAMYVGLGLRMGQAGSDAEAEEMFGIWHSQWNIFRVGTLVLWLISLAVACWDAWRANDAARHTWTVSGIAAAVSLSLLTGLFLLFQTVSVVESRGEVPDAGTHDHRPAAASKRYSQHFSHHVYLGGYPHDARELPAPPSGDGYLRGRFIYDGKPAEGVTLSLALNGKYESAKLTTGANGEFTLRLPVGEWSINRLVTHDWSNQPEAGAFVIITGLEPKLIVGNRYNEHYWMGRDGWKISVGAPPSEPQVVFTIRKRVALTWPAAGDKSTPTTLDQAVVRWEPHAGAKTYLLRVAEIRREGKTTAYYPVANKVVTGATRFPLVRLAAMPSDDRKEYQVSVFAFAEDGTYLSESERHVSGYQFVLTDNKQLAAETDFEGLGDRLSEKEMTEIYDNNRRIDAMQVLLRDGMTGEAERLLKKLTGKADPGRKAAITGYLMAKRGRCAEANRLFAQAQSEGGTNCVPDSFRAGCEK